MRGLTQLLAACALCLTVPAQAALGVSTGACTTGATATTVSTTAIGLASGTDIFAVAGFDANSAGCNGNTIAVTAAISGGGTTTFTAIGSISSSGYVCSELFYAANVPANSSFVATATFATAPADPVIAFLPITGAALSSPLDAGPASNPDSAGAHPVTAAYSTSSGTPNEILVVAGVDYYPTDTYAANSGYTLGTGTQCAGSGTEMSLAIGYKIVSSQQTSVTSGFTVTGTGYTNMGVGTFIQASASTFVAGQSVIVVW